MRCETCTDFICPLRRADGNCMQTTNVDIFTAPDTRPSNLGNGQWDKGYEPAAVPKEEMEGIKKAWLEQFDFYHAASDLVDAVERYMRQECLRSELMLKKETLKELLK